MLATTTSLTSANRIKRRCTELGSHIRVIQTPQILSKDGCGYSLRFEDSDRIIVYNIAKELGIRIRDLYSETISEGKKIYTKTP